MQLDFSIIIPIKELNLYVNETVDAIQRQSERNWELFIVTNEEEPSRWPTDTRVKLLSSGRVGPAEKRDLAAAVAQGRYLVFLDDDSFPAENHLEVALIELRDAEIDAIGGPAITPKSDGFWQQVSGATFLSRLSGGAPERYRPIGPKRAVDDWPSVNFVIRRAAFLKVGGFDSPYWPGEDTFLCWKLDKHGSKINYVPELLVWHHRRPGLRLHLKQIAAYGLHRGYFMKKFPETSFRVKYLLPLTVLMSIVLAFSANVVSTDFAFAAQLPLAIYLVIVMLGTIEVFPFLGFRVAIASVPYVLMTHVVYGLALIRGLTRRTELVSKLR